MKTKTTLSNCSVYIEANKELREDYKSMIKYIVEIRTEFGVQNNTQNNKDKNNYRKPGSIEENIEDPSYILENIDRKYPEIDSIIFKYMK